MGTGCVAPVFAAQATTTAQAHERKAQEYLNQKQPKLAIPEFKAVLAADPTNLNALNLFDPQLMAIRRLVDNRFDTVDNIDVLQFDLRQRLQTKRGYPGAEHIIDWMTLDTSFSYFPEATRDNFGKPFGFMQYQYVWNIGDRTAIESTGWYEPESDGPRVFTVKLTLVNPGEEVKARYVVMGLDPLWVIRNEDFEMLAHWDHPMKP